ncbi:hypothetical protein ABXT08_20660 [Chryseobacterium sp. NRRL B-14859]|uniref:hypothetical protein n=1 Tax=Chryseobacterium sp. NRRL B-14859 TaxID=1562763 RepID=UPI0033961348
MFFYADELKPVPGGAYCLCGYHVSFFCFSVFLFLFLFLFLFFSLYHTATLSYHQYSYPYHSCHPVGIQTKWTKSSKQVGKTDKLVLQPIVLISNPAFWSPTSLYNLTLAPIETLTPQRAWES